MDKTKQSERACPKCGKPMVNVNPKQPVCWRCLPPIQAHDMTPTFRAKWEYARQLARAARGKS